MNISNELLVAYAEGKVLDSERSSVRQYLTEHPNELESVMMMMDEDYELEIIDEDNSMDLCDSIKSGGVNEIVLSAAAFAPPKRSSIFRQIRDDNKKDFATNLDSLIDELDL